MMKATITRTIPKTVRDVDVMQMLLASVGTLQSATKRTQERGITITLVVEPVDVDSTSAEQSEEA